MNALTRLLAVALVIWFVTANWTALTSMIVAPVKSAVTAFEDLSARYTDPGLRIQVGWFGGADLHHPDRHGRSAAAILYGPAR